MTNRDAMFKRQLRQFRILTIVGYAILLLIIGGMIIANMALSHVDMSIPVQLPIALVGVVLLLAVAMPFLWVAYDKTRCPHCGNRIEEGYWYWHGIRCNGPTRRYWKLFLGRTLRCPHCQKEVIPAARPESAPYLDATVGGALRAPRNRIQTKAVVGCDCGEPRVSALPCEKESQHD